MGFGQGRSDPNLSTLNKWQRALEAGVQFIDDGTKSDAGAWSRRAPATG